LYPNDSQEHVKVVVKTLGQIITSIFQPGMFTQGFMINAFISGTIVAILSGLVGFFVVLRGSAFVAHVLPKVGFAGAAGAVLLGMNPIIGLAVFSVGGALSIGLLGKRGRHDVVTALILVVALGTGALFLVLNNHYAAGAYSLLFGQLVGVSSSAVLDTAILGIVCISVLAFMYRPLLLASITKESAEARGIPVRFLEMAFLVIVGLATATIVPVVGALLSFSLMIGPAATAQYLTHRPMLSKLLSVGISVITIWISLILAYDTGWTIGFFVATLSAVIYGSVRVTILVRK
jgi:zinc/manganese transport system permease protein